MLFHDELIRMARIAATPIDFDDLIKKGVLVKRGDWYRVNGFNRLPSHVQSQVRGMRTDRNGKLLLKFPFRWKTAQQFYKTVAGKDYDEG